MNASSRPKNGFSLIELIFVLFLIGIISMFGYVSVGAARNYLREHETKTALQEIINDASFVSTSGIFSFSALSYENIEDGYGRSIKIIGAKNSEICAPSEGITVTVCKNTDCTKYDKIKNVALFAASAGADGRFSIIQNSPSSVTVYPTNDDITGWITFPELAASFDCGGAFRIITKTLPPVRSGSVFSAQIVSYPPADKWCAESDTKTAKLLGISESCANDSSFISSEFLNISAVWDNQTESGTKMIRVYAIRGGAKAYASYALPFIVDNAPEIVSDIFAVNEKDTIVKNQKGENAEGITPEKNEDGELTGFQLGGRVSKDSICLWVNHVFSIKNTFRMYYEVKTLYKDRDIFSMGDKFGGYGLVLFSSLFETDDLTCGESGSAGLGYSKLNFNKKAVVMETDLYPDPQIDYKLAPISNHTAFIPCIYPLNGQRVCFGSHLATMLPSCTEGSACRQYELTGEFNKFEDAVQHPVRVELDIGYSDAFCTSKKDNGTYMLARAWTDCADCADISRAYTGASPDIYHCMENYDSAMKKIRIGFTFGSQPEAKISFKNILFSIY